MKKRFMIEELCCANCAAKMEEAIRALKGVESANVNFLTQKLTLEAAEADFPRLLEEADAIIRRIEPDCVLVR
jgi:copper chaperone CopZ